MASLKDRFYFQFIRPGVFPVRLLNFRFEVEPPRDEFTGGFHFEVALLSFGVQFGVDVFWDGE